MIIPPWQTLALDEADPAVAWQRIAEFAVEHARVADTPAKVHNELKPLDRALAEAAWPLWEAFPASASTTVAALRDWWQAQAHASAGRAVLILDGLSLRELAPLLKLCADHGVTPLTVRATGATIPTDTDHFAQALGLLGRAKLKFDQAPPGFVLAGETLATDVLDVPFEDCITLIPPQRDLVIWHTWPDVLFDSHRQNTAALATAIASGLAGEGFWRFLTRLRQGRQVVITSDHGYATTNLFAIEETGPVKDYLARVFGAQRLARAAEPLRTNFIPPPALTFGDAHVVVGQRWWKIQGGYPHVCHGGLSLLEALSPFIILPEVA